MGIGEVRVHLQHVLELDDGLRVLLLLEVRLRALSVFRKAFRVVLTRKQHQHHREQGAGAREITENHGDTPFLLLLPSQPIAYPIAVGSTGSAAPPPRAVSSPPRLRRHDGWVMPMRWIM